MKIKLDFTEIKTEEELHDYLQAVLDLPHYYGRNLDALWDCIGSNGDEYSIKGKAELKKNLGKRGEKFLQLFAKLAAAK